MILLIDIGNTASKYCFCENESLGLIERCAFTDLESEIREKARVYGGKVDVLAVSSVRKIDREMTAFFSGISKKMIVLDSSTRMPLQLDYSTLQTLGPDRIAAAAGAHELLRNDNCIVFDLGTAITIDIVTREGIFKGGNISLGLNTRFRAIHTFTDKLPLLNVPDPRDFTLPGKSTAEAIENGVVSSVVYEIEGYLSKYPDYKVVFTGGDAFYFASMMKKTIFAIRNLVMIGLLRIALYNAYE